MINKTKNNNLQVTIKKESLNKLIEIQKELTAIFNIELSKSQVIEYLINKYEPQKNIIKAEIKKDSNTKTSAQIIALKTKLNVSWPRLAEIVNIPETTIKKYKQGKQAPNEKNKQLLEKALKQYKINL